MEGKTVLVVEDDANLLDVLRYNLTREGYRVAVARDGQEALDVARQARPDLLILDIMLPKLDGLEVCRILRKEMTVPILMLTAKADEIDKVVGLEVGADDYVTKPFSLRGLQARVRAMLRRSELGHDVPESAVGGEQGGIVAGDLTVDLDRHVVLRGGVPIALSPKEFDLLAFLAGNRRRAFSREYLLEKVWGYEYAGDSRTVDVHVRWLRQKIEADPAHPVRLLTVRGLGYKLEA
ncbi:MAG: response regulator transcription factor [Dehalococcoidia bacterium]|jgi:two-component system OmpR family response regulator|nr:response regulator transcription factor [Dehalococcoidia bacterium]